MYNNFIAILIVIFSNVICLSAYSQNADPVRIAIIDIKKVETSSLAWKSLSEQIEARRSKLKDEIQAMQSTLEEKAKSLEAQRTLLSSDAFAVEVETFKLERAKLDQAVRARKQSLDKVYLEARGQIRLALNKVITTYVQEQNISLILKAGNPESSVYFTSTALLIDDVAIQLLDAEIQQVNLSADIPAQ